MQEEWFTDEAAVRSQLGIHEAQPEASTSGKVRGFPTSYLILASSSLLCVWQSQKVPPVVLLSIYVQSYSY